jgi:chromosome segregation ATPase
MYLTRLKEEKEEAERRLQELAQENQRLREEVTRLVKAKEDLEARLRKEKQRAKQEPQKEFWSNLLREKANLELRFNNLQRLWERKDLELSKFQEERKKLDQTVQELLNEKLEFENKLTETRKLISSLSQSLEQEKEEKLAFADKLGELEKEKESLQLKLEEYQEIKSNLDAKIQHLQKELEKQKEERQKFAQKLAYINQILEDKMLEVTRLQQDLQIALQKIKKLSYQAKAEPVELPKIEIDERLEGRVVSVDNERGFVVIDLGKRDGIKKGMQLKVYRNDKLIAKLEVMEVREVTSAAKILLSLPQDKIAVQDLVYFSE